MKQSDLEGYVIVAVKDPHYLELAVGAAASLRYNDNKRPIALLIGEGIVVPRIYYGVFDYVIAFDPPLPFNGYFTRRFVINRYSPFARSLHVDPDCLLIKRGMDSFWAAFGAVPFAIEGTRRVSGKAFSNQIDIDGIIEEGIAPWFLDANGGVFYFLGSSNPILSDAQNCYRRFLDGTFRSPISYCSEPSQHSDEPIWGVVVPRQGVGWLQAADEEALQVTSAQATEVRLDPQEHILSANKQEQGNVRKVSGQLFHFCDMQPAQVYIRCSNFFRRALDIPLATIVDENGETIQENGKIQFEAATYGDNLTIRLAPRKAATNVVVSVRAQ